MNAQIQIALIAAGCTMTVGLMGMGVIRLLRRASLRLLFQVSGAVLVLAIMAGTLGTAEAMFLSPHDLRVVAMVCVVAAVVAIGFGGLLGRQVEASSLALRQAARSLGDEDGGYRSPAGPMTAELAALSRELAVTGEKLKASRERERALEQSRRQLVAWVSHDLRMPLAGLRAMAEALEDGIAAEPDRYHRQIRAEVGQARQPGGRSVRAFPNSVRHAGPVARPGRPGRAGERRPGQYGGTRAGSRCAAHRRGRRPADRPR